MINLLLIRDTFSEKSTIGELFLNGERICDTLENPWVDNQRNVSCIPEGVYPVRLRLPRESASRDYLHLLVQEVPNRDFILVHRGNFPSQTQGCLLVENVENRSYILFHRGNSAKDTRGCILVGLGTEQDVVHNSVLAMDLLIKEILHLGGENINLIIKNK